jgi:hypothetical protein
MAVCFWFLCWYRNRWFLWPNHLKSGYFLASYLDEKNLVYGYTVMPHWAASWCNESRHLIIFILFLCVTSSICTNLFRCIQRWNTLHWQREWLLLILWYWDGSFFLGLLLRKVAGIPPMFHTSSLDALLRQFLLWLCFRLFRRCRRCRSRAFLWFGIFTCDLNYHLQFLIPIIMRAVSIQTNMIAWNIYFLIGIIIICSFRGFYISFPISFKRPSDNIYFFHH